MVQFNRDRMEPRLGSWLAFGACLLFCACGGEADRTRVEALPNTGTPAGELIAVPTEVYGPDFATSTSFIPVVPSLDVERIGLDRAREWDGRASAITVGQWLFVASSSSPVIRRFTVEDSGRLTEAGSLGFSNYGVPEFFSIDPWGNTLISPTKSYIFNGSDGGHVVWNPTTLEITGEIPGPDVVRDGWTLESVGVVRGNRLYRIFSYLDYDEWRFDSGRQLLGVYDTDTDELIELVEETRCPLMYNRPFLDESNALYFSGWVWTPTETLVHGAPKNCALRIVDGETRFDPSWQLTYADDITGGREAAMLRYLGNGKALLDVFHDERTQISAETNSQELANTPNWRLWEVDLESRAGAPVEGLDFKAGGYTDVVVGDRTFLMVPNDDYSETTAHEVVDGEAVPTFTIQGSSYQIVRLK